ncbi:MAG: GHKL domain-containing protein [Lacrimispora sp.]
MQLLGLASLIIFDVFIILRFKKIFPPKRNHWFFFAAAIAFNVLISTASFLLIDHRFAIYLMLGAMVLSICFLFNGNRVQILYAASIYIFFLYTSRGIVFSVYSLVLHTSIKNVLEQKDYYGMIFAPAVLLCILYNLLIRKVIFSEQRIAHLFHNRGQLKFVVIYLLFQWLFITLINDGRFYDDIRQSWFSALYLGACVISNVWLIFILHHTSKISELFEYELHTHQLQEQLSSQMRHYQSYRKYTESYRAFRHDYKHMMNSMKTLLHNKEYERAIRMFDDIHDTMQQDVQIHKAYSDNVLLDAILQDAANDCEEKNILFSARAHLPEDVKITELGIVRVFANVIDNAIEACSKIPGPERFIEITSNGNKDWATIEIINSFNGELLMTGDEPKTTKKDKDLHGFGLRIIKETIENLGGLVFIEPDQEKKIFKIRVCIPKASFPVDSKIT